jgi:DNA-binding transcriptional regulator YiaG
MEQGLFQRQVAERLGIDHFTYITWETGRKKPYTSRYVSIIRFLGYDPLPPPTTLGDRIRARRRELGVTQRGLAAQFGWDRATVFHYERGTTRPTGIRLERLDAWLRGNTA